MCVFDLKGGGSGGGGNNHDNMRNLVECANARVTSLAADALRRAGKAVRSTPIIHSLREEEESRPQARHEREREGFGEAAREAKEKCMNDERWCKTFSGFLSRK